MPERAPRLPCPVCLGVAMVKVSFGPGGALEIDRCARCAGIWLDHGEIQALRTLPKGSLSAAAAQSLPIVGKGQCHACHTPMDRAAERCGICGRSNLLDCPHCDRPMRVEQASGLRLDVCPTCKGAWFDHHELDAIWSQSFDRALARRRLPGRDAALVGADVGAELLFHSVIFGPDLIYPVAAVGADAVAASAEVLSHLPEALQGTPEIAAQTFEAVGEAAGGVFEAVVDIISGIF
ncbi:MAG: zf-TFIIB domain-containing protein [Gemmatimonadales bacterium]